MRGLESHIFWTSDGQEVFPINTSVEGKMKQLKIKEAQVPAHSESKIYGTEREGEVQPKSKTTRSEESIA